MTVSIDLTRKGARGHLIAVGADAAEVTRSHNPIWAEGEARNDGEVAWTDLHYHAEVSSA